MSLDFLKNFRSVFGGTRKNKKLPEPMTPPPLSPSPDYRKITSPSPSLSPPKSSAEPISVTKHHTKKHKSKRRRDNSLRRLAILQSYAKKLQAEY